MTKAFFVTQNFQLQVRDIRNSQTKKFAVNTGYTIKGLKELIYQTLENHPKPLDQILVYNGKVLQQDTQFLGDVLQEDSIRKANVTTVHLIMKQNSQQNKSQDKQDAQNQGNIIQPNVQGQQNQVAEIAKDQPSGASSVAQQPTLFSKHSENTVTDQRAQNNDHSNTSSTTQVNNQQQEILKLPSSTFDQDKQTYTENPVVSNDDSNKNIGNPYVSNGNNTYKASYNEPLQLQGQMFQNLDTINQGGPYSEVSNMNIMYTHYTQPCQNSGYTGNASTSQNTQYPHSTPNNSNSFSPYYMVNPVLANAYHAALDAILNQEQQMQSNLKDGSSQEGLKSIDYAKLNSIESCSQTGPLNNTPRLRESRQQSQFMQGSLLQPQSSQPSPDQLRLSEPQAVQNNWSQELWQQVYLQQQMAQLQLTYMPPNYQGQPRNFNQHSTTLYQDKDGLKTGLHELQQNQQYFQLQQMPSHYMNVGMGYYPVQLASPAANYYQPTISPILQQGCSEGLANPDARNYDTTQAWNNNNTTEGSLLNKDQEKQNAEQNAIKIEQQNKEPECISSVQNYQEIEGTNRQGSSTDAQQARNIQPQTQQQSQQQVVRNQIQQLQNNIQGQGQPQGRVYHYVIHINLRVLRNLAFQILLLLLSLYIVGVDHTPWNYMYVIIVAVLLILPPVQYLIRSLLGDLFRAFYQAIFQGVLLPGSGFTDILQVLYDYLLRISTLQQQQATQVQAQGQDHIHQLNNRDQTNNSNTDVQTNRNLNNQNLDIDVNMNAPLDHQRGSRNENIDGTSQNVISNGSIAPQHPQNGSEPLNRELANDNRDFANSSLGALYNINGNTNDNPNTQSNSLVNLNNSRNNINNSDLINNSSTNNNNSNQGSVGIASGVVRQQARAQRHRDLSRNQSFIIVMEVWRALMAFFLSMFPHWNFNNDDASFFAQAQQQQEVDDE